MAYFLMLATILCFAGQGFFNKYYSINYEGPKQAAPPVFAAIYGVLVFILTLIYAGFSYHLHLPTVCFGLLNGLVLFLYNLSSINAARRGPYTFQGMLGSFGGIIVPLAISLLFWKDHLSLIKIIGILLMLAALFLYNCKGFKGYQPLKGYYFWVILLFLFNGCYNTVMDAQQRVAVNSLRNEMVMTTFLFSAVISSVYLLIVQKKDIRPALKMGKKALISALISSVCASAAVNVMLFTLRYVPASILYTTLSGGGLITNTILSVTVLKEKLSLHHFLGIAVAVAALVIMNLPG